MTKLQITDTILRDAHQSQAATRMKTEDMIPACKLLDDMGYWSIECWGGATFDACMRFLHEDPWERLRTLKKHMPKTRLQMLFRGQNILGYKHYADDVVEQFCKKSIENGIDVVRVFDALNDPRNLESAIKFVNEYGGHCEAAISDTVSPVHNLDYFVKLACELEKMGADSICIKDMAALLTPYTTAELVTALKEAVSIPIQLHTHYTSGLASMCLLKGIEAGADILDTAMSPLALGTSHAPTESMVAALKGTEYDTGLDLILLNEIRDYFMTLRKKYLDSGLLDPKMLATDANALIYQVPGGMLSNLLSQLKQAGKEDQLQDVLNEVPRVREDSGYPPLVTPTSQIVGTQAVFNVITGERYKMCTNEFKDMVAGKYGTTPMPIDPEFQKKIIGDAPVITGRPADLLEPELDTLRKEMAQWSEQEEDVLSYAMFPKVSLDFFKKRQEKKYGIDGKHADKEKMIHPV